MIQVVRFERKTPDLEHEFMTFEALEFHRRTNGTGSNQRLLRRYNSYEYHSKEQLSEIKIWHPLSLTQVCGLFTFLVQAVTKRIKNTATIEFKSLNWMFTLLPKKAKFGHGMRHEFSLKLNKTLIVKSQIDKYKFSKCGWKYLRVKTSSGVPISSIKSSSGEPHLDAFVMVARQPQRKAPIKNSCSPQHPIPTLPWFAIFMALS